MNTTLFAACLARLGLSQADAEALLGIKLSRIKDMSAGRARVPDGVWSELRDYEDAIAERSDELGKTLEDAVAAADGEEPDRVDAVVDDAVGLMALADFVLGNDVLPGVIQVGIVRS